MSNGSEQDLLYCSRVNELKTAVPSQNKELQKRQPNTFFFQCYFEMVESVIIKLIVHV